jgi:hypothetical protein
MFQSKRMNKEKRKEDREQIKDKPTGTRQYAEMNFVVVCDIYIYIYIYDV